MLSNSQILGSSQIAGIAWHGYGGTPGAMSALHDAHPALGNYDDRALRQRRGSRIKSKLILRKLLR